MARIAEDLITRLKAEVPLERVVAAAGVELARRGKDLVARCPFHEPDEEPSLVVTPGKGLWRCFGCGKGGTVIDWRMEISGESFRAAVESLATEYLPGAWSRGRRRRRPSPSRPRRSSAGSPAATRS